MNNHDNEPPRVPEFESTADEEFEDIDFDMSAEELAPHRTDTDAELLEERLGTFYEELVAQPQYARSTARFKSAVVAYARGDSVLDICDNLGVTRTELAIVVKMAGVSRGMDSKSMAPEDVANLYAMLYAAQLEIEDLRRQLAERD